MTYIHSSGPNGCRKNCKCCREEREQQVLKYLTLIILTLSGCSSYPMARNPTVDARRVHDGQRTPGNDDPGWVWFQAQVSR